MATYMAGGYWAGSFTCLLPLKPDVIIEGRQRTLLQLEILLEQGLQDTSCNRSMYTETQTDILLDVSASESTRFHKTNPELNLVHNAFLTQLSLS